MIGRMRDDVAVVVSTTTGRLVMFSIVRIATSGTLMIGMVMFVPNQPVLSIVNVPPWMSSRLELVGAGARGDVGDRPVEAGDRQRGRRRG